MLFYYETSTSINPRTINGNSAENVVSELKKTYGDDLLVVYTEEARDKMTTHYHKGKS